MDTMLLYDFLVKKHEEIERFKSCWVINHNANIEDYPMNLSIGDWEDQFQTFSSLF